jgi:hypothetical protein
MIDLHQLNLDLCAALGVEHAEEVQSVVLVLSPHALPSVTVTRLLRSADGLSVACATHRLKPETPTLSVIDGGRA